MSCVKYIGTQQHIHQNKEYSSKNSLNILLTSVLVVTSFYKITHILKFLKSKINFINFYTKFIFSLHLKGNQD